MHVVLNIYIYINDMLYFSVCRMRCGIFCYIILHVERALVFVCCIFLRVKRALVLCVAFFACGTRPGVLCYIFLRVECALVILCCIFLRVERALVFCVMFFCVWNALWYFVFIYFPAFLFMLCCIIFTYFSLNFSFFACLKLSLIYTLWFYEISCYIFLRVE